MMKKMMFSLGKGEVESSIPSGSTTFSHLAPCNIPATKTKHYRTTDTN
jgi:hypothetical protein